jgi:DNA-binding LytR/AlgR family response regulator
MHRLLIIEDEEDIRDIIQELFEQEGYETYVASGGAEGIKMALRLVPDIILCDIMMPGLDGFQVKQKLSETKSTQAIPFIYLTAKADYDSVRHGMNLGADDYISKPIRNNELVEIVSNRLKRIRDIRATIKENSSAKLKADDKILLNLGKERLLIPLNDIIFIDVLGNYTEVHTVDKKKTLQKKSLKAWEEILPEKIFIRVHHKTIINFNYIQKIEPFFNSAFVIWLKHHPESIICSKRYSQKIKKTFVL